MFTPALALQLSGRVYKIAAMALTGPACPGA
jgi:hypothetical protein